MAEKIFEWIVQQKELLALEREAEIQEINEKLSSLSPEDCETLGYSLIDLDATTLTTGLFGRFSLSLRKLGRRSLPSCGFKVGEEVSLVWRNGSEDYKLDATVAKFGSTEIEIFFEDSEIVLGDFIPPLRLNRRVSDVTYNKTLRGLDNLSLARHPLVDILMNEYGTAEELANTERQSLGRLFNADLNVSQIEAIEYSLKAPRVSVVHGPPGTGKTSTLTEFILQAVLLGKRILVCAPSNVAVDNILERLVSYKCSQVNCIRLGHPVRINSNLLDYCLDAKIAQDEGTELVQDIKREIESLRTLLAKKKKKSDVKFSEIIANIRFLQKDLKRREKIVVKSIIQRCNVVFATCIGASSSLLANQAETNEPAFDIVVIDEAAQALEAACWVPILQGKCLVLAGDHCQLPPTVKSPEAEAKGLGISLFERIILHPGGRYDKNTYLLDTQYRMHHLICSWASIQVYKSLLKTHSAAHSRSLNGYVKPTRGSSTAQGSDRILSESDAEHFSVMTLVDTSNCGMEELTTLSGSHSNPREALVVLRYVVLLLQLGLRPQEIGVITPYNGQVEYLRRLFVGEAAESRDDFKNYKNKQKNAESRLSDAISEKLTKVEVRTVDGFQGGEKECIVISLVRSNPNHEYGFLGDHRRINVGVTRARRHIAVICDVETCQNDPFIRSLLDHITEVGDLRSAMEFDSEDSWRDISLTFSPASQEPQSANSDSNVQALNSAPIKRPTLKAATESRPKVISTTAAVKSTPSVQKVSSSSKQQTSAPQPGRDAASSATSAASGVGEKATGSLENEYLLLLTAFKNRDWDFILLKSQISNLLQPSQSRDALNFIPSITSYQRMVLHEVAEKLGLVHRSTGEHPFRFIQITKQSVESLPNDMLKPSLEAPSVNNAPSQSTYPIQALCDGIAAVTAAAAEAAFEDSQSESDSDAESSPANTASQTNSAKSKSKKSKNKKKGPKGVEGAAQKQQQSQPSSSKGRKLGYSEESIARMNNIISTTNDEDELLRLAIEENQKHARFMQYRVSSAPMPNPDRAKQKSAIRSKLDEMEAKRKPVSSESNSKSAGPKRR